MAMIWYLIVSGMLAAYAVLDGFDFGAGIIHLVVARTEHERRTVLAAIGPIWDGNEVWLIAGGGVLVYAFPRAYSAAFGGFYMALMMTLWLLILRGIAIEFRPHQASPLWRSFWDGVFAFSSVLMAIVLGAALGNVLRGVPLDASGFFSGSLFTDFRPGVQSGILDWFTVLVALFTLAALALHGSLFLIWKTEGVVRERCRSLVLPLWGGLLLLGALATWATLHVRGDLFTRLAARPGAWPLVGLMLAGGVGVFLFSRVRKELPAFLSSCLFLSAMLGATAAGMYPNLLISSIDPRYSLTAENAAAGGTGLQIGLFWWLPALALAVAYFTYLFRSFRGKVRVEESGH